MERELSIPRAGFLSKPKSLWVSKAALKKAKAKALPKPKPKPKARLPTPHDAELRDLQLEKRVLELRLAKVNARISVLQNANLRFQNKFGTQRR